MRRKRNEFRTWPVPASPMSPDLAFRNFPASTHPTLPPADLAATADWFHRQPDGAERFRWALRDSLDEVLDGQRTGRWAYAHLTKTEKTHLGTMVEVNLTKEFSIPDGDDLDWEVAGSDLDCKFSKDLAGWEIPMEMYLCPDHNAATGSADHPALLVWLDDDTGRWGAGLLRMSDQGLRWKITPPATPGLRAYNRDNKRKISPASETDIFWLWGGLRHDLPPNVLLQLDPAIRDLIFRNRSSGQARVNALFDAVTEKVISRSVVLTVAQQDDSPKRARDARLHLRPKGIIILGHESSHRLIAKALGLSECEKGEWLSARVLRVQENDQRTKVWIPRKVGKDGVLRCQEGWWARASAGDPDEPGPLLP